MSENFRQKFARVSPTWLFVPVAVAFHAINPSRGTITFKPRDGLWKVTNVSQGHSFFLPDLRSLHVVGRDYSGFIYDKYTLSDFAEVKSGETVVDIGAFVGAFSLGATERAANVHAVEPTPGNAEALRRNTADTPSITVHEQGIWSNNTTLDLEVGIDSTDNSFIDIDGESSETKVPVDVQRLDTFLDSLEESVDFLKVDAEGAEPEVLATIGEVDIPKIAVDAGEERAGEATVDDVRHLLDDAGYDLRIREGIVYGRKP